MNRDEMLAEFEWTRPRHHGRISDAAPILGTTPAALQRRLHRAKQAGHCIDFIDDTKSLHGHTAKESA